MATIPPWLVTPDAAGQYTRGFGLGLDVAQRRAAQAVQQQQMALQAQSMEQARQTAAENAARQAIALQMEQQFRSAKLAADANALAQAKTLADAARAQAATLAGNELAQRKELAGQESTLREKEMGLRYAPKPVVKPTGESIPIASGNLINVGDRWQYVGDPRQDPMSLFIMDSIAQRNPNLMKNNPLSGLIPKSQEPEYDFDPKTGQVVKRK